MQLGRFGCNICSITAVVAVLLGACDTSRDVSHEAKILADKTTAEARDMATRAGEYLRDGQLSASAKEWLHRGAEASREGIEAVLERGQQAAPVAMEIGRALASASDSDTMFEPIYQEVSGASPELALRRAEADAAIRGMTRVEVIDGLEVGFKELASVESGQSMREQAYLVVWRQDAHLVGFVYRSRRVIALAALIQLAPRLVALARSAM